MKVLLAKSINVKSNIEDKYAFTLEGHLELGIIAAQAFGDISAIICEKLDLDLTPEQLIQTVMFAIWLHDWGKANEDFQAMMHKNSNTSLLDSWYGISKNEKLSYTKKKQSIRHELLSVILAVKPDIFSWLKSAPNVKIQYAILAVLGHHLKVRNPSYFTNVSDNILQVYTNHDNFEKILKLGSKYLGLSEPIPDLKKLNKFKQEILKKESCKLGGDVDGLFIKLDNKWKGDFSKLKNNAVIKALVMSADLAASALLTRERGKHNYTDWIKNALAEVMSASDLDEVIKQRLQGKPLLKFQKDAIRKKSRVLLVIAGCGAGKSIVPFCIFKRLAQEDNLKAKIFFCYPTTATTSQGFIDYAVPTRIENTILMHSRSWVDEQIKLKNILEIYDSEGDEDDNDKQKNYELIDFQTKVEALKIWHSKLTYCTAHTVLGLFKNHRKGLYGFPGIAQGAFVFDEIHAYPPKLFGTLLQFIRVFSKAPIVLMSASMSQPQIDAIQDILEETQEKAEIVEGPKKIEDLPRYKVAAIENQDLAWDEVIKELEAGGKVLWITNQVADSQKIYTQAVDIFKQLSFPIQTLVYHSRFRYQDSCKQHEKLMQAFRGEQAAFAVTTQIAEMSLDISATLLISANAPIWALIQRLGRLNRWVEEINGEYKLKTGRICKAFIYPWARDTTYKQADLDTGTNLVEAVSNQEINQTCLAEEMGKIEMEAPLIENCEWLQTWKATSGELMDAGYTIQVVLAEDKSKILHLLKLGSYLVCCAIAICMEKQLLSFPSIFFLLQFYFHRISKCTDKRYLEVQKWAVSVQIQDNNTPKWDKKTFKFYRVAPTEDIHYHPEIGAYNPKQQKFLRQKYGHNTNKISDSHREDF